MCHPNSAVWYIAMAGALVAGQTRRVDERLVVGAVSWRRGAIVLVCGDAHRLPHRRATASARVASVAGRDHGCALDGGRFGLAPVPAAQRVRGWVIFLR